MVNFAVDAHVGKSLFHDAIVGSLRNQGKTVIFVTHALHFLSYCDYIYTLRDGRIAEQGTFQHLIEANGEFARLDKEFGGGGTSEEPQPSNQNTIITEDLKEKLASTSRRQAAAGTGKLEGKLIVKEHRSTGSISKQGNVVIFVFLYFLLFIMCQFTRPISVRVKDGSQLRFLFSPSFYCKEA